MDELNQCGCCRIMGVSLIPMPGWILIPELHPDAPPVISICRSCYDMGWGNSGEVSGRRFPAIHLAWVLGDSISEEELERIGSLDGKWRDWYLSVRSKEEEQMEEDVLIKDTEFIHKILAMEKQKQKKG